MDVIEELEYEKDPVWDCGSKLYDSLELNSIQRLVDSAVASMAMLMRRQSNLSRSVRQSEKPVKLSRSIHKVLRSVPRKKPSSILNLLRGGDLPADRSDDAKARVWNCGSTLCDSLEFNSFKPHMDKIQKSDNSQALVWDCGSTLYDSFELNSTKRQIDKIRESGNANALVWDCGTTLYDSFELNSVEILIDYAIASRSTSMPHLPDRRSIPPSSVPLSKKPSKLSKSIHKLLRSVCPRKRSSSPNVRGGDLPRDRFNAVQSEVGPIPRKALEVDDKAYSPEISSLVRKHSVGEICA